MMFLWKHGRTDYTTPSAFPSITISGYIRKIVESLLDARLRRFFKKFNLKDEEQQGLQSHKSTVRLYRLKMECQEVRMRKKLYQSGVRGKLIKLFESISKSRQLSIEIGNLRSHYFGSKDGLPEGSVLSPIRFFCFVSDMFKNFNCKKFKLADDGNLLVTGDNETQVHVN